MKWGVEFGTEALPSPQDLPDWPELVPLLEDWLSAG